MLSQHIYAPCGHPGFDTGADLPPPLPQSCRA